MKNAKFNLDNVKKLTKLESELDLNIAQALAGKLRWMAKEDESLVEVRKHLKGLIKAYEKERWSDDEVISDDRIDESYKAEHLVALHSQFITLRKDAIQKALKKNGLKQKDLAVLLGHRASYMSELINGLMPFSKEDIVVLYRLFEIELDVLMDPFIKLATRDRIRLTLKKLNKPQLKLREKDLFPA